jgi:hypothetical protein
MSPRTTPGSGVRIVSQPPAHVLSACRRQRQQPAPGRGWLSICLPAYRLTCWPCSTVHEPAAWLGVQRPPDPVLWQPCVPLIGHPHNKAELTGPCWAARHPTHSSPTVLPGHKEDIGVNDPTETISHMVTRRRVRGSCSTRHGLGHSRRNARPWQSIVTCPRLPSKPPPPARCLVDESKAESPRCLRRLRPPGSTSQDSRRPSKGQGESPTLPFVAAS